MEFMPIREGEGLFQTYKTRQGHEVQRPLKA